MEAIEYRKKEIAFTSLRNCITFCSLVNLPTFNLGRIAKVFDVDEGFLRLWQHQNRALINKVLGQYGEEITEETKKRSMEGEGQGGE